MKLDIDNFDLDYTARVLYKINDAVSMDFSTWESFRNFIVGSAYTHFSNPNTDYMSTYGFELSASHIYSGVRRVSVSVSAFTVAHYIGMVEA